MPETVVRVRVNSATTGKAQRMIVPPTRSREIASPMSAEELQKRQNNFRKTRRPAGPQSPTRAAMVGDDEAVPDVEETNCEERSAE